MRNNIRVALVIASICFMGMLICRASERLSPPSSPKPETAQVDAAQAQWDQLVAQWEEYFKLPKEQPNIGFKTRQLLGQLDAMAGNSAKMAKQIVALLQRTPYGTSDAEEGVASLLLNIYTRYPQLQEEIPVLQENQYKTLAAMPASSEMGIPSAAFEYNGNVYLIMAGTDTRLWRVALQGHSCELVSKIHSERRFWANAVRCDRNNLFAAGNGVIIFSLAGKTPKYLNTATGLPSDNVTALTSMGDKLIFALGGNGNDNSSYLVTYDLKTDQLEYWASNVRREKTTPLDTMEKFTIRSFLTDIKHEKLYFFMAGSTIWQRDMRTGTISLLWQSNQKNIDDLRLPQNTWGFESQLLRLLANATTNGVPQQAPPDLADFGGRAYAAFNCSVPRMNISDNCGARICPWDAERLFFDGESGQTSQAPIVWRINPFRKINRITGLVQIYSIKGISSHVTLGDPTYTERTLLTVDKGRHAFLLGFGDDGNVHMILLSAEK